MRLLLVEDDPQLSHNLKQELSSRGYAVDTVDNGIDAEHMGDQEPYDLIILDLGLPRRPGLEVLTNWRRKGKKTPVIILTARDAWNEKVDGFKAGCDDYVAKPFHYEELVARIGALLRRSTGQASGTIREGGFTLDEERQVVILPDGTELDLTGTEFRLLRYFMLHPGQVLSKSRLSEHVYEYDEDKDSNVIEVYINRLRQKLGKESFETRRGQGYVFRKRSA